MNAIAVITYAIAVGFWILTGTYGLLASRTFIVEQFLKPGLFPPLTIFANYWAGFALISLALWVSGRRALLRHRETMFVLTLVLWLIAAVVMLIPGLSGAIAGATAGWVAIGGVVMVWAVAMSEHPAIQGAAAASTGSIAADFAGCVIAAIVVIAIESAIAMIHGGAVDASALRIIARTQVLAGMAAFLILTLARGIAGGVMQPVRGEARMAVIALAVVFGWFLYSVAIASISLSGSAVAIVAYLSGYVLAVAVTAPALVMFAERSDGVRSVAAAFAPGMARHVAGFVAWIVIVAVFGIAIDAASRISDWSFVLSRLGVLIVWLCALGGSLRLIAIRPRGRAEVFLGFAVVVLIAYVATDRDGASASTPAARWALDVMRPTSNGPAELYALLPSQTNVTGGTPVDVSLSPLSGPVAANRPNIFLFIVDSLRRDYVSPYNERVTFTPSIASFAKDSIVFDRAFTQYGATGLSVPSIWTGGSILHRQYVTPYAPMNALAKLLTHEQYAEWMSVDNIVDVIVPKTGAIAPLDSGHSVKDFRFCGTLDEIRARLVQRAADAPPLFAYSLPQDIHISVITREGARSIDGNTYDGFYAPVASRVRRFDACFGAFVDDLKSKGLYDNSIIVFTADHGDSLGEEGRMGHAYTLYPEIVRIPMIIHVPAALRAQFSWDPARAAFTTDLTPTLYQLLGHAPIAPGSFYGQSLARAPGTAPAAPADRMIASSYGAVYAAVMKGGTELYVADAIERREMQFALDSGAGPGHRVDVTAATRREGTEVITNAVQAIARAYGLPFPR